jgi:hypothetical protein
MYPEMSIKTFSKQSAFGFYGLHLSVSTQSLYNPPGENRHEKIRGE